MANVPPHLTIRSLKVGDLGALKVPQGVMSFYPGLKEERSSFRMSKKCDLISLENLQKEKKEDVTCLGIYKKTAQRVRPVDSSETDGSMPGGIATWKKEAIAKEVYVPDPSDHYAKWLIPRFSGLKKGS